VEDAYFQSRYAPLAQRDGVWRAVCSYLQPFVPVEGAVLDLGAGYCSFINHIRALEKHAVDLSPGFARHAGPGVRTAVGPCTDLSRFSAAAFDVVFASNLLEHLTREEARATLKEIFRVTKPGGALILVQPNFYLSFRNYFDDYTHAQIFTHRGLADLVASEGFTVETVEPRFLPFSFKSRLPCWRWLVRFYLGLPWRPFAGQMLVVARAGRPSGA
jgi:SAM-dependent methyltransferase